MLRVQLPAAARALGADGCGKSFKSLSLGLGFRALPKRKKTNVISTDEPPVTPIVVRSGASAHMPGIDSPCI